MHLDHYFGLLEQALQGDQSSASAAFTPASRLQYYPDSIRERFIEALNGIFPCCRRLVGDDCWWSLLGRYLKGQTVENSDLSVLGRDLAEFIKTTPLRDQLPYFSEMAQFEWLWFQCFHGKTGSSHRVISRQADQILQRNQTLQLMSSRYPLAHIWEMCQTEYQGDFQVPSGEETYYFAFISLDQQVQVKGLTLEGFKLLEALQVPTAIKNFPRNLHEIVYTLQQHDLLESTI